MDGVNQNIKIPLVRSLFTFDLIIKFLGYAYVNCYIPIARFNCVMTPNKYKNGTWS